MRKNKCCIKISAVLCIIVLMYTLASGCSSEKTSNSNPSVNISAVNDISTNSITSQTTPYFTQEISADGITITTYDNSIDAKTVVSDYQNKVGDNADTVALIQRTGGMQPLIALGDVVIVRKDISSEKIKIGDIIVVNPSSDSDSYVVRRVTQKLENYLNTETTGFKTKGDANEFEDVTISEESQVIGLVVEIIHTNTNSAESSFSVGS